jgi:hypothetical protein
MAAPDAPGIYVTSDGHSLLVRWRPVPTATDYNVYVSENGAAFGIEEQVPDDDIEDDGWFAIYLTNLLGAVRVKATALNALAEESEDSNTIARAITGNHTVQPTAALRHVMKGAANG